MKTKIPDAALVWKQLDDILVPRLALGVIDRAVYSYLLRHSHLEGKSRIRFSILWLARGVRLSGGAARHSVRRLLNYGVFRLVERSKSGHVIEVLLPDEIRAISPRGDATRDVRSSAREFEQIDFLETKSLRQAIHARDGGSCFYCLRRLTPGIQCLDHVVARVHEGGNSYRNLVSCCAECNSQKADAPAGNLLRWLYRQRRLTADELAARLQKLEDLAAGKLRPVVNSGPKLRKNI